MPPVSHPGEGCHNCLLPSPCCVFVLPGFLLKAWETGNLSVHVFGVLLGRTGSFALALNMVS